MTAGAIAVPTVMPLRIPNAGVPKNHIDSNTLIEIHSDTPNTRIYYTVDNTRPEPDKKLGGNTTLLYKDPFMLRHGKRSIKALARTRDGRESNVVTKVFNVQYAEPNAVDSSESDVDNAVNFQNDLPKRSSIDSNIRTASVLSTGRYNRPQAWGELSASQSFQDLRQSSDSMMRPYTSLSSSNKATSRDFVRCVYCDNPRPKEANSRFCPHCGKPVPIDSNSSLVEPGSMGMCTKCRSYVPLSQSKCIVCEESIEPRPKPTTSIRIQDEIICGSCESRNPSHLTHCASCEHRFPAPVHSGSNAPPLPRLDGELIRCPCCSRVNNPDARFCDWCGEKPIPEQSPLACSLCKHNNRPYSKFCSQCGSKFIPPDRMDPRNYDLGGQAGSFPFQNLPMWQSVPLPTLPRPSSSTHVVRAPKARCNEVQTQTVGLFYPGGKKIYQEQEMLQEIKNQELRIRDKQPPLTAISPGKGYWRKQLDHICGHLRGYTNNNVEFRSVVSEPRLGKILTTGIDESDEAFTISVTFALKGHTEYGDGGSHGLQRDLYQSKKKIAFGRCFDEEELENERQSKKGKKKGKKKTPSIRIDKMNPEERLLIRELGPRGEGRASEVKQLLKEGADPNCLDQDRRSVLSIAVCKDNIECVKELAKGGADVNRRSGPHHDTPMHYAVKLGPNGKEMVKLLLQLGAQTDIRNETGLTAYNLAVRNDYNTILALFNEPKEKPKPRSNIFKKKKVINKHSTTDEDSDDSTDSSDTDF